jgi:glycosyltransferase involved in cell wall biosynthesis
MYFKFMNIGIDIKALFKGQAGIAAYIANTLDKLQEIDLDNHYFLFEKQRSSYRIVNQRWTKVIVPSRLPGTLWLMLKVPRHFSTYNLDVFWGPEQVIPCMRNPHGVRMVSTILDLALKRCPRTMQTTNYFINRIFLAQSIRCSERILTISQTIKNDICLFFPQSASQEKVTVTYPGRPQWSAPPDAGQKRSDHLLFAGSLEPRKNLLNLLKALNILKTEKRKQVFLRIVGPGGWKNKHLRDYVEKNNLSPQVSNAGYLSQGDLIREYCQCKAFVYPSLYEGFGLPVLESLVAQTPVLTSKGTAMEEIAGECTILFDPNDPNDIAEKIDSVFQPDFNADALMRRSAEVLKRFSWDTTARQTLAVLTEAHAP